MSMHIYGGGGGGTSKEETPQHKRQRLILDMRINFVQNVCYQLVLVFSKLAGFHQDRRNSKGVPSLHFTMMTAVSTQFLLSCFFWVFVFFFGL